jgi:hypothetical protein
MAVRTSFTSGEVLTAADLTDTFGSKLNIAGGKILQIVQVTNANLQSTTSTTYVNSNLTVTITPQKSDSAVLLLASFPAGMFASAADRRGLYQITDSSNNAITGAEEIPFGQDDGGSLVLYGPVILLARATPATTSAVSYKVRLRVNGANATTQIRGATSTAQMYAIEVSA